MVFRSIKDSVSSKQCAIDTSDRDTPEKRKRLLKRGAVVKEYKKLLFHNHADESLFEKLKQDSFLNEAEKQMVLSLVEEELYSSIKFFYDLKLIKEIFCGDKFLKSVVLSNSSRKTLAERILRDFEMKCEPEELLRIVLNSKHLTEDEQMDVILMLHDFKLSLILGIVKDSIRVLSLVQEIINEVLCE